MPDFDPTEEGREQGELATAQKPKLARPRRFKVLLHNDDYTTMEFVVEILVSFFEKNQTEAVQIMLNVHHRGIGVCGVFTREVAETKVHQVTGHSRKSGMPLKCTMESE
jgi:ATP-dependent Clp protease adaptor protein ClpS